MSKHLSVHNKNPHIRYLKEASNIIENGGVIVLPTDSGYTLITGIDNKNGFERIMRIREVDDKHLFTLLCKSLSDISKYARVDDHQYRLLKKLTPGAYTFILMASKELPKRVVQKKRKTIGIRVSPYEVIKSFLDIHEEPVLSSSLMLPESLEERFKEELLENNTSVFLEITLKKVDLFLSTDDVVINPTTVIDLSEDKTPKIIRKGQGSIDFL